MLSFSILLGLTTLASTSPLIARNSTFSYNGTEVTDGHYLDESITTRTFFNGTCTKDNVATRKEWRSLQDDEKKAFIKAELCLMNLPGKTGLPGALTRFDDFQASHQQGTNNTYGDIIHYTVRLLKSCTTPMANVNIPASIPRLASLPDPRPRNGPERRVQLHRHNSVVGRSPRCCLGRFLPIRHVGRQMVRWQRVLHRQLRYYRSIRQQNPSRRTSRIDNRLLLRQKVERDEGIGLQCKITRRCVLRIRRR